MKNLVEYKKGGNKGGIITNEYAGKTTYITVTVATSKDYKTLKAAEKFMSKMGYEKI